MISATMFEAKTQLSDLVRRAQQGETVIITSGRDRKPVAQLQAIEPVAPKRLGVLNTPGFEIPASFWEPMDEEELRLWEGEGD